MWMWDNSGQAVSLKTSVVLYDVTRHCKGEMGEVKKWGQQRYFLQKMLHGRNSVCPTTCKEPSNLLVKHFHIC
jgi:hypothetical protein